MTRSIKTILAICALGMFSLSVYAQTTKVVIVPLGDAPPEVRAGSEIYTNSIGMKFSLILAGSFVMGSPAGTGNDTHRPVWPAEGGRYATNENQHIVTLSKDFYMQITEVTQAQYQQVMGSNPASFSNCGSDCPVESVSWNEAQSFVDALNVSENRSSCNTQPNTCYSLPSESQWEYAARGATNSAFYNGDITATGSCATDTNLNEIGWYCDNSDNTPHPVAQKAANQWGLYDMSGNVGEWCEDWYDEPYPNGPETDPSGPDTGSNRVTRGGSWNGYARDARSANRGNVPPENSFDDLGLRLVLPQGQ